MLVEGCCCCFATLANVCLLTFAKRVPDWLFVVLALVVLVAFNWAVLASLASCIALFPIVQVAVSRLVTCVASIKDAVLICPFLV